MTELEDVIRGWAELTEVEEKPRWVRAKEPEKMNFSTLESRSEEKVELSSDAQSYVDLERQLTGEEWLLAVVAREQGFLRLDLARESGVEVMDIDAGAEIGAVT